MAKRDPFAHRLRAGAAYRADRLEEERIRIERRLVWAIHRGDDKAIDWLEGRLLAIEEEIDADLSPGRAPGRIGEPEHFKRRAR